MGEARRLNFPLLLINRCQARRDWRYHACTGAEAVRMQRTQALADALYGDHKANRKGRG